jgi:hypothetical protein
MMDINKILDDDDLSNRYEDLMRYVGEVCGHGCVIIEEFDLEKAKSARHGLMFLKLGIFTSCHVNNHSLVLGPCVQVSVFANKMGWSFRIELQLNEDLHLFVEPFWWEIQKFNELQKHLRPFMVHEDADFPEGFGDFLIKLYGRNPYLLIPINDHD